MNSQEKELSLTLSPNDVNVIVASLGKQPLEAVNDVYQKIVSQVKSQIPRPDETLPTEDGD